MAPASAIGRRLRILFVAAFGLAPACEKLPNVPPTSSFFFSPVSPIYAGQTSVLFNGSASRDTDGHIVTYIWNFGDGTPQQSVDGPTTTHVFPDTSATCLQITYAVSLVTVDNQGDQGFSTENVAVIELPAPGSAACVGR